MDESLVDRLCEGDSPVEIHLLAESTFRKLLIMVTFTSDLATPSGGNGTRVPSEPGDSRFRRGGYRE